MKKSIGIIAAVILVTGSQAFASLATGTLTITAPGFPPDEDGPYTVVSTPDAGQPNLGTFETFCIGSGIGFNPGGTYSYSVDTIVQPFATVGSGGLSYVALGTAYLYSQYRLGAIGDGSANDTVNDAIQQAIWFLQGQSGGVNNSFVSLASGVVGAGNLENDAMGMYGVYALNLTPGDASGDEAGFAQPQLCILPEPSTVVAGALMLLPLGVGAMRSLRKDRVA